MILLGIEISRCDLFRPMVPFQSAGTSRKLCRPDLGGGSIQLLRHQINALVELLRGRNVEVEVRMQEAVMN